MKKLSKEKAFTLLEMLIVIGIIAVLVSLAAVSYTNAQKKSRDARRKSDLKSFQSSMEQYYSICGFQYPTIDAYRPDPMAMPTTIFCPTPSVMMMESAPLDPKTGITYDMSNDTATSYKVCATMDVDNSLYCVSNQQ